MTSFAAFHTQIMFTIKGLRVYAYNKVYLSIPKNYFNFF